MRVQCDGLPRDGVVEALSRFVVMDDADGVVGVAGLEVHGADGVLRSVAVSPTRRGLGMGRSLTETVIRAARAAGLRRLYLLTTTAEEWFPRFGFRPIPRAEASAEVRRSVEFTEVCPDSAQAMVLDLEPEKEKE